MTEQGYLHSRSKTYGKVQVDIIHDLELTDGDVRQYAHMHWRYGSNQSNFEGMKSMSKMLGVSRQAISKRIRRLEAKDWVVVIERMGKQGAISNFYHVFEHPDDCREFRRSYSPALGETVRAKSDDVELRKSRTGLGGKPDHKIENLNGGYVKKSLPTPVNVGLQNLDSLHPDSEELKDDALIYPEIESKAHILPHTKRVEGFLVQSSQPAKSDSSSLVPPEKEKSISPIGLLISRMTKTKITKAQIQSLSKKVIVNYAASKKGVTPKPPETLPSPEELYSSDETFMRFINFTVTDYMDWAKEHVPLDDKRRGYRLNAGILKRILGYGEDHGWLKYQERAAPPDVAPEVEWDLETHNKAMDDFEESQRKYQEALQKIEDAKHE